MQNRTIDYNNDTNTNNQEGNNDSNNNNNDKDEVASIDGDDPEVLDTSTATTSSQ